MLWKEEQKAKRVPELMVMADPTDLGYGKNRRPAQIALAVFMIYNKSWNQKSVNYTNNNFFVCLFVFNLHRGTLEKIELISLKGWPSFGKDCWKSWPVGATGAAFPNYDGFL